VFHPFHFKFDEAFINNLMAWQLFDFVNETLRQNPNFDFMIQNCLIIESLTD